MSVPSYKRNESKIEYVYQSYNLVQFIANICTNKFSKKYTFYGVNKAYEFASKICECCVFANLTNVNKDYEKRLSYLQDAKKYLKCLSMQMNLISHYENKVTDNQWIKFTNDTDKLEKLINGVIKSDKSRQETLGV